MTQPPTSIPECVPAAIGRADTHLIFNTVIRSEIALPELPRCVQREPAITIVRDACESPDDAGFTVCHEWRRDGEPLICTSARRGDVYRLSFPDRASFYIRPSDEPGGATISCRAAPGANEDTVRQLLLSQVIPRWLAHRGALLLHASAVTLPTGKTVAFLGSSGQGKSTLASYCQQRGAHLIDDDCILLHLERGSVSIVGGVPAVRLFPDSLRALGLRAPAHAPESGTDKLQLSLQAVAAAHQQPRVLDALLLLDQPAGSAMNATVEMRPATGQAAMMALLHGAFHLDPADAATITRGFSQAAAVLRECQALPVHHLCYPRQHDRLPDVLQAVLELHSG